MGGGILQEEMSPLICRLRSEVDYFPHLGLPRSTVRRRMAVVNLFLGLFAIHAKFQPASLHPFVLACKFEVYRRHRVSPQ